MKSLNMLGLKLPTDPRWVNIVEKNVSEILTDHAYCEQKAASNAISTIVKFPEHPEVVKAMTEIAMEEMEHFGMVHAKIIERGFELGEERADPYVGDLIKYLNANYGGDSHTSRFVNKMLFSAMVEARSCERFKILSEEMTDPDLKEFYWSLMESEARHYTTFLGFARKYGGKIDVNARWEDFLAFEATLMEKYGKSETMHGQRLDSRCWILDVRQKMKDKEREFFLRGLNKSCVLDLMSLILERRDEG